jgi:hypothetical protein
MDAIAAPANDVQSASKEQSAPPRLYGHDELPVGDLSSLLQPA